MTSSLNTHHYSNLLESVLLVPTMSVDNSVTGESPVSNDDNITRQKFPQDRDVFDAINAENVQSEGEKTQPHDSGEDRENSERENSEKPQKARKRRKQET